MRKFNITKLWNGDPIPDTDSKIRIEISMQVLPITKSLELRIVAPYIGTSDIPDYPAGRCPRLYDFEVVEVFIASTSYHHTDPSTTPYFEIIVGPHGHYLAISHTGQGNLSECDDSILLQNPPPLIQIAPDHQSWSATLQIPYELLPEPVEELHSQFSLNWKFNSYAIHGKGTDRVYMALSPVPGDTPNFHQLEHFVPLTLQDGDPLDYPPAPPLSTTLSSNSCGDIGTVVSNASGTSVVRINTYSVSNNIDSVTKVYTECGSDLQSHIINYYIAPDYTISDGILPKYSSFSMNGIIKQRTTSVDSTTSAISQYSSLYSIPDITNMTSKQQFLRQKSELSVMSTDSVEIAINKENQFNHQYNQISNLKFVNFSMNNIGLYDTISSSTHDQSGKINHSSIQIDDGYADDDIHNIDYDDNGCKKKETLEQVITRLHEDNSHMCGYIFHENVSYYDTLMHMNEIFDLHLNHSEKILVANLVDRKLTMSSKARYLCLTSQPRVICLDPTGRLTGSVSWSSHSQVIATQMTDHKFTLCHVHKSDSHGAMGDSHQQEQLDTIALFSQKTVFQRLFMQNKSTVKNQRNCPKSSSDNSHNTDSSQRHAISSDEVEPYISIQYQFLDSVYGSEVWVRAIQDINSAWERRYMPCIVSSI